jgi:hypothetical protein
MFYWIYDLPTWPMVGVFCVFFVGITWLGILFVRPVLRAILGKNPGLNDSVGYLLGAHGVYLGVLLGLLAVEAYQNFASAESVVGSESSKLAGLYRDVATYPEPYRTKLMTVLRVYTEFVIKEAWPLQQRGLIPTKGTKIINQFERELMKFEPLTITQQIMHAEAIHQLNAFTEARRARLEAVGTGIPAILWTVVIIGAGVAIFLMWILDMKLVSHFVLSGVVSFYLGTLIALVAAMDNPFRGEVSVSSDPYQMVLDTVMAPEPPPAGRGVAGTAASPANANGAAAAKSEESLGTILAKPDAGYVPPAAKTEAAPATGKALLPGVLTKPVTTTAPPAARTEVAPAAAKEESLESILAKPDTGYVPPATKEGAAPAAKSKDEAGSGAKPKDEGGSGARPKEESGSDAKPKDESGSDVKPKAI